MLFFLNVIKKKKNWLERVKHQNEPGTNVFLAASWKCSVFVLHECEPVAHFKTELLNTGIFCRRK